MKNSAIRHAPTAETAVMTGSNITWRCAQGAKNVTSRLLVPYVTADCYVGHRHMLAAMGGRERKREGRGWGHYIPRALAHNTMYTNSTAPCNSVGSPTKQGAQNVTCP